ncbi:SgcJ/EcaC family oxidoreductase [Amycolatopsis aidingensis]|uniref:SgcJ/EcaC family oxidoreductase n=1 Tax=Amycolatopsis aidingensis TaxID=2842453 RepID=UPI001C0C6A7A|nr:SgcJ/EcaC family oxidoreductase [Amycolatopsis aidingensis]
MTNTTADRQADIDAIERVVATLEHSQQNELPEEFIGLFRADAIWTTAHGKRLFGRAEIAEFTRTVLPGAMRESTVTYEVEHIMFISPDVAAVKARGQYRTLDGEPTGNPTSPMYVLAREGEQWLLVACQNTEVLRA